MELLGAALSSVASIIFFTMVAACTFKAFHIASTLSEMKELLADIKRNTNNHAFAEPPSTAVLSSPTVSSLDSAENLLRAVTAELDHPVPPARTELERKS